MKLAEKLNSKNRKLSIIEICDSLESQGHIDSRTSSKIIRSAKISKNHPLIVIERLKILSDQTHEEMDEEWLENWLCDYSGVPSYDLDPLKMDPSQTTKILPKAFIKRLGVLPVEIDEKEVTFATCEPFDRSWLLEVSSALKKDIKILIASPSKIKKFIEQFYEVSTTISKIVDSSTSEERLEGQKKLLSSERGQTNIDDGNVSKLVDWMFQFAVNERATDIHLEPKGSFSQMRFRVDGTLRVVYRFEPHVYLPVIARIKIMANMKVDEKRRPQDGRIKREISKGTQIEMRLSTVPTPHGEKLVLRLFDPHVSTQSFSDLGFSEDIISVWKKMINSSNGLLLVTGPTGSGKTTTLQTSLNEISTPDINICTVEDPVEIINPEFNQVQVHPEIGLSFANAVRAFLRQDPDVIMVGEIRDQDTAEMAIQASLTGHLVLSTLHTNSALSTITRLLDIGVEPHLLTATLVGIMAQRLVKVLCPHCKKKVSTSEELWKISIGPYQINRPEYVFNAVGCKKCKNTGYHGRVCVYELVPIIDELREKIGPDMRLADIEKIYRGKYQPLRINALEKVVKGITDFKEIFKIIN